MQLCTKIAMEFAIVQIASVDMPESLCYKFADAQQKRPDKNLLTERKKKKREKRFGEVAYRVQLSTNTNHLVTLQIAFRKEARKLTHLAR